MSGRRRVPPLHRCRKCSREFRAWREDDCPTCGDERRANSTALAEELRRRRIARRAESTKRTEGG